MKLLRCKVTARAFDRADLIIVVVTLVLLAFAAFVTLSAARRAREERPHRPSCIHNLKQIGLAFRIFANENNEQYPFAVPDLVNSHTGVLLTSNVTTARAWMHFQALSNELQSGYVLLCPQDTNRWNTKAANFLNTNTSLSCPTKRDLAVSYFVGLNADETKAEAILSGDRNLSAVRNRDVYSSVKAAGAIRVSQTSVWADAWPPAPHGSQGNTLLADGSVQQITTQKLQQQLMAATNAYGPNINLFLFPQ